MQATYGLMGAQILVNGTHDPYFEVESERVRLRVLNGATMRFHHLSLGKPFHVVATDQGFLDAPVEVDGVLLSAGERVEIVVDLEPGKEVSGSGWGDKAEAERILAEAIERHK